MYRKVRVAQWIARLPPKQKVVGSNPTSDVFFLCVCVCVCFFLFLRAFLSGCSLYLVLISGSLQKGVQ